MTDPQGTLPTANTTSPTAAVAQEVKVVTPSQAPSEAAEFGDDPFDFELDALFTDAPAAIIPASPRNTPAPVVMASLATEEKDDKPKRPLSAYNIFFKLQRKQLIEVLPVRAKGKPRRSHGKIGFADMARTIAFQWKRITPHEKAVFQRLATADKKRYTKEMKEWKRQNQEDSENEAVTSERLQSLADYEMIAVVKKFPPKDAPAPSLPSLTLDDAAMSLSSRLSEAQQQFASSKSALSSDQQMHAHRRLQLMQSLGFEAVPARAPESGVGHGMQVSHRGILDMAVNQNQTLLLRMDGAENNAVSFLPAYKQQQQLESSMSGTVLPSTAGGLALPIVMPQGSLGLKNPGVAGADRMQPPTMASKNKQHFASSSSSSMVGGGGDRASMAYLANSMGPECCEFLIDIFHQD